MSALSRSAALLGLAAALVAAAPVAASPRSEAEKLIAADARLDRQMRGPVDEAADGANARLEKCSPGPLDAPKAVREDAVGRSLSLVMQHTVGAVVEQSAEAQRRYAAFEARSRAVRRMSRAMSRIYGLFAHYGSAPPDICGYYVAWRDAGWDADFRIDPPAPRFDAEQRAAMRQAVRTIVRSGRAFRRFGVPRKRLARFVGSYALATIFLELPDL